MAGVTEVLRETYLHMMLRPLLHLLFAILVVAMGLPGVAAVAAPVRQSVPTMPDCTMAPGCCDTGAPCVAACADRWWRLYPQWLCSRSGLMR